jgi:hypothetical protein
MSEKKAQTTDIFEGLAAFLSKNAPKEEEMVTISKAEYESLLDDRNKLECLDAMGVDNWQGYDDAMQMYREEEE